MKLHHHHQLRSHNRGFSLIEMLVVIAVIGVIAGIGLSNVSNVNDSAKMARDQRNAQNICSMFNSAKVSGVAFASATKEEILDELITGVTSPDNGINYKFTPLDDDQKVAALDYCEYDSDQDMLKYVSVGGAGATAAAATTTPDPDPTPDPPADPVYGPWTNFEVINNHLLVGRLDSLRSSFPEREWRWVPTDPYLHDQSQIQYRTVD